MPGAPVPPNESKRLEALRRFAIVDTPSEPLFDDIASVAAALAHAPIALISLVEEHRQWFKARVGFDACETSREHSFCAYTILGQKPMVIENALEDARFSANPLVTREDGIRFYAGAPLIDREGNALGSICVIDRKPRSFSPEQQAALQALARTVVQGFESRRAAAELAAVLEEMRLVRSLLPICGHCKGIRNDQGYYQQLEEYFEHHADVAFSHGICPQCLEVHYPQVAKRMREKASAASS